MRRSIATVSVSGTLREKLEAIAAARFDAVEIFENDLLVFNGSAREVRGIASDLGLEIALYQPFRDFEGVSDEALRRNLDRAERKFDVMEELGAPLMLVCSNVSQATLPDPARAAAQLRALAERAAGRGLRVGYEALAWGAQVRRYGEAWALIEAAAHPHLGLVLDSFHTLALGDDPAGIARLPGDRIFFVQLADAPKLNMDVLSWSRHFRCFPGQGDFDVAGFAVAAARAGYAGPLSLEIFNDEFRASSTRQTALDGMRSLLFLEEQMRARREPPAASGAPSWGARVALADPPPPPVLKGVSFLEFAVDRDSAAALASLLDGLGFRCAGKHRSKEVTLYQQGRVGIVLNAESDSFAHSYYLVHGPSICAICLAVDDALRVLGRADEYGCTRFEGRIGPNERHIPAIRSLDGSLLYFVEDDFDFAADFALEPSEAVHAPLRVVDHVAQAVPDGQFDSWILFYRAVLGLEPEDIWMLPDPYGLVRSRAVASRDRSVRFPLSFSESHRTATARSVSTYAGAGVHHVAFATDDIFGAVARLRQAGVPLLPIPENYYDDLAVRFELDEALVDRLRRHHVLYDRNAEGGEFFHVYTTSFEDRFFFEVLERRGGYDQYGAVNAPVRMSAQAQLRAEAALPVRV
jgi:4-hydroxyphenylpyruvate dioxygenase